MAEDPLSLYQNPQNPGAAFILNNPWVTPLEIARQKQQRQAAQEFQVQQQEAQFEAQRERDQERYLRDAFNKLESVDMNGLFHSDFAGLAAARQNLTKRAAELRSQGIDWSNAGRFPEAYKEIQALHNDLVGKSAASKGFNAELKNVYKNYQEDPTQWDRAELFAQLQAAENTADIYGRKPVTLEKLYNENGTYANLKKAYGPAKTSTLDPLKTGQYIKTTTEGYTEPQIQELAALALADPIHRQQMSRRFSRLSDQEKGRYESEDDFIFQKAIEGLSKGNFKSTLKDLTGSRTPVSSTSAGKKKGSSKEDEAAALANDRFLAIQAILSGDPNRLSALKDGKHLDGRIIDIQYGDTYKPQGTLGTFFGAPKEVEKRNQVKIKIAVGEEYPLNDRGRTDKRAPKEPQYQEITIDPNDPGAFSILNTILNSKTGEKKVPFEEITKLLDRLKKTPEQPIPTTKGRFNQIGKSQSSQQSAELDNL